MKIFSYRSLVNIKPSDYDVEDTGFSSLLSEKPGCQIDGVQRKSCNYGKTQLIVTLDYFYLFLKIFYF